MPDLPDLLITLIYVSAATELFSKEELVALLKESAARNTQAGITGMLLYKDGNIIKVLEGPEHAVQALFTRIQQDPRHKSVSVILKKRIAARNFPDWSMGFRDIKSPELRELPAYSEFLNTPFTELANPSQAQQLLDLFKRRM